MEDSFRFPEKKYMLPHGEYGIVKVSDNEYRVDGNAEFRTKECKTVTVDGEVYKKEYYTNGIINLGEDFSNSLSVCKFKSGDVQENRTGWRKYEFDEYQFLGIPKTTIWDYTEFNWSPMTLLADRYGKSSSSDKSSRHGLFCHIFLGDRIIDFHHGRVSRYAFTKTISDIFDYDGNLWVVAWQASGFGFEIKLSIFEFLNIDFSKINHYHMETQIQYIPEIKTAKGPFSDEQKLLIAFRIFESLINTYQDADQQ